MSAFAIEDKPAYQFITESHEARACLDRLQLETLVGIDTETYWDTTVNHSRVSLVQIAPPAGEVLVIDLLTVGIEVVRPLIESPGILMAAHNARFDEGMLISAGLKPLSFVDTLRLARATLRLPSYSLASVCAHLFGLEIDKSLQKSNWRRRPLTRAQLEYAALDAHLTLRVYEALRRTLVEQGRFESAHSFAVLKPSEGNRSAPRKRRAPLAPLRLLTNEERKIVARLKKWRLEESFEAHVPAYMICPDRTLEQLVIERPNSLDALNSIYGLGQSKIMRYGEELLEALRLALQDA